MSGLPQFSEVIGDIYEASYQPDYWPRVIEHLARISHSRSGALFIQDTSIKEAAGFYGYRLTDQMLSDYAVHGHNDPGFLIMQDQPVGVAINMHGPTQHPPETPEYFRVMRQKYDLGYVCGANVLINEEQHVGLGLHRSFSAVAYEDETLQLLSELIPHLQRALRIHREFIRLRIEKTALTAGFDNLMIGLVLFDHLGSPVYVNPVAESIFAEHPAIQKQGHSIVPTDNSDAVQLRRLILSCLESAQDSERGGVMGLHHPDKRHPLAVMVKPVAASELANVIDGEPVYAAMYLSDPERPLPIAADTLRTLYDLTPTEARIAVSLTNGLGVEEIATTHQRSVNTVRSHLRSLFEKTRTANQADLVRLLLTGAVL